VLDGCSMGRLAGVPLFKPICIRSLWIGTRYRKRFTQSLHDPLAGGMKSDVELQNLTLSMFDYEEAVQGTK
jgi:hypothetical protein